MQQLQGGGDYKFKNGYLYTQDGAKIMLFIDPRIRRKRNRTQRIFY